MATPAAPRLKTHWFKVGTPKSADQTASAVAFVAWRAARHLIDRMRAAGFDVEPGAPYFGFLRETLLFLLACADRLAYARFGAQAREPFTTALVHHVARQLHDNETDLLGAEHDWGGLFVDQFNVVSQHYAEFGWTDAEGPDFAFVRYFGSRLEPFVPERDRRWVIDQVMALEAPAALDMLRRSMQGVHSTDPRPKRRESMSGE